MTETIVEPGPRTFAGRSRRTAPWWLNAPALGGWTLGFALVVVLGLSGGGYDAVIRGETGIAAWWIAGAGVAAGAFVLPRRRPAWVSLAIFSALVIWTVAGLSWTDSTERTVAEIARATGYLGILLLAVLVYERVPARNVIAGVACGIAVIGAYAVLTRLQPDWFGTDAVGEIFPTARRRLAAPVGYWNGLAGLFAIGVPLLLAFATDARRVVVRAAAASAVPVLVLGVFLAVSRGGVVSVGAALIAWFALAPDRLPKLPVLAAVAAGGTILCLSADGRDALQAGVESTAALRQGEELQTIVLLVMAGVAAMTAGIGLLDRHATRPVVTFVPRRIAAAAAGAGALVGLVAFFAVGGPGWLDNRFEEFKGQGATPAASNYDDAISRLKSVAGNGRWQMWVTARDAQREDPLTGIGPGTFEYLWAREKSAGTEAFVRDAHSLWAETLGELGWVGFLLVLGFFGFALAAGAARALSSADRDHRAALAAATAGLVAFCAIATVEWAWELTVLGATGLLLAAACVAGLADGRLRVGSDGAGRRAAMPVRVVIAVVAVFSILLIAIPTGTTGDVRDSQRAVRAGDLAAAYRDARAATRSQPYSASAWMQEALVLERAGELGRARAAALRATAEEPTNWRTWLLRSRLDVRAGDAAASVRAYRRARSLNPASVLFSG